MNSKKLDDSPISYRVRILRETLFIEYPFSLEEMIDFENNIDFKILSKSHIINWDIEILERFKDKWDWEEIQNNPFINAYYNLGLLFSEFKETRVSECKCELKLEFCKKQRTCYTEFDKEKMKISNRNILHENYSKWISFLISEDHINSENLHTFLLYETVIGESSSGEVYYAPANKGKGFSENENIFNDDEVPF